MIGHDRAIANLKALIKPRVVETDPAEHVEHLASEIDRAFIILNGSMLDDLLLSAIEPKVAGLNSDERSRFFHFEGPAGTFSSRIKLAQRLGVIDRKTAKLMDMFREMRNAAAHAHAPLTFETKQIRDCVMALFKSQQAKKMEKWSRSDMRFVFGLAANLLSGMTIGAKKRLTLDEAFEIIQAEQPPTLRGKSRQA